MANLPPKLPQPSPWRKTLFLPSPGVLGVVVQLDPKPSRKARRFDSKESALAWCEEHRVNFYYYFNETAS